jgi:hypothetical protein
LRTFSTLIRSLRILGFPAMALGFTSMRSAIFVITHLLKDHAVVYLAIQSQSGAVLKDTFHFKV